MKKSYHILLLPSWYPKNANDASGSFFREQALALYKEGHQVGVITYATRSLKDLSGILKKPYGLKAESDYGVQTYRYHTVKLPRILHDIDKERFVKTGEKLFEKYISIYGLPDILHVHSLINAGFLALKIADKYKIPFVITEHSSAFARNLVPERTMKKLRSVVSKSSTNIAVSAAFANFLQSKFVASNWIYIPNIVSNDFLEKKIDNLTPKEEFIFINVCLLTSNKRLDLLIKSFAKAFKGDQKVRLEIGGDGPVRSSLEELVQSEGISSQVTFLGLLTRKEVQEQISKADAFVLSSDYETFSVVVIEALALGKPVIATRCGGPESTVTPDVGYLVKRDSIKEMANVMKQLYTNRKHFDSEKIRAYCSEKFSEKTVIKSLENVYAEAISSHRKNEK